MLSRGSLAFTAICLLTLGACTKRSSARVAAPFAPAPIAIAAPSAYSGASRTLQAERPDEICAIDPAACPSGTTHTRANSRYAAQQMSAAQAKRTAKGPEILLTGPLAAAPAISGSYGYEGAEAALSAPSSTPPATIPVQPGHGERAEQFDIEAKVELEVLELEPARRKLVALAEAFDGQVMNEAVEDGTQRRGAALSLRIPSPGVRRFVARLGEVGKVRSSSVETREVSRALSDATVVQSNLEHAITRYEELLAKAANVAEATQLEAALMRVRTELARVRSDIEWSRDRVARSTVYVTLIPATSEVAVEPVARFYPGIRAAFLLDVPPKSFGSATTYAGGGLSLQWGRAFDIDVDFLHELSSARSNAIDFYVLTLGAAFYSDYFGGGARRTLNPYLGFRTGYARAPGQNLFPLGATLGLELYKSERVLLAFETRAYAMIGRDHGPDFVLEPALGLNLAY